MRVLVHFKCDGRAEKWPVDPKYLREEMDAIEYRFQDHEDFDWVPERDLQITLIEDMLPEAYIDPFQFSWPFRRAVIENQARKITNDC